MTIFINDFYNFRSTLSGKATIIDKPNKFKYLKPADLSVSAVISYNFFICQPIETLQTLNIK